MEKNTVINLSNAWWVGVSDSKKVSYVDQLYNYRMTPDEIRKNISNEEIQELYYLRELLY